MSEIATSSAPSKGTGDVLGRLVQVTKGAGADALASTLAELRAMLDDDMRQVEADLSGLERRETPLHLSAQHLLALGGKRLRPLCVALSSRCGAGFVPAAREIAVAVELVHNATLLHDDVVDVGDVRRGAPSARVLYGNAASVFAGDWLLVDALERVSRTGVPGLLEGVLSLLKEMLDAESLQLSRRGVLRGDDRDYFTIVEGKTASLFRWAMGAGARAARCTPTIESALSRFGFDLGVSFQMVDDLLDLSGDPAIVGKSLFTDLREGKATYPLLLTVAREPRLGDRIEAELARGAVLDDELCHEVTAALFRTGAVDDSRAMARELSARALSHLEPLPEGPVRAALEQVAAAMLHRSK